MTITRIQKAAAVSNTAAFSLANTTGNLLVAMVQTSAAVTSLTDTAGNTWVRAATEFWSAGNFGTEIWYVANCVGGANTVTFANGFGASFAHLAVAEYSGMATTSPVDGVPSTNFSSIGNPDSGPTTITGTNDLLIGAIANNGARTETWGTGWASQYDDTSAGASRALSWAEQIVSVAGSYDATATLSGGASWVAAIVAFQGAGGISGPTSHLLSSLGVGA